MFRGWVIVLFVIIASTILFSRCSSDIDISNGEQITQDKDAVTINFIGHWLNEGKREDLVRNFARDYEFRNQNIRVNLKFPEEVFYNREDLQSNQKFVSKMLLKDNPEWDIIRVNGEYQEILEQCGDPDWPRKYLVDFSEIKEFRDGTQPELLTSEAKKSWNGIIPGPYIEGQFWALWCNKVVAQKIGLEVKQYGMSVDDFIGYLKAVNTYNTQNPDKYITPVYESVDWPTTMVIAIQMFSSLLNDSKEFFSGQITERRLNAWAKTLEAIELMSKYKPLNPGWKNVNWDKTKSSLVNEECLFYINGSWMYNIWQSIDDKKIHNCMPTEFPSFNKTSVYPGGYQVMWAVLKNAPHKEEAIRFLLDMNRPAMSEMWVRYTKCPTGIKGNLTGVSFGGDQFENFSYHIQDTYGLNTYRYYESSSWVLNESNANTPIYYLEVIQGQMTAKEAIQKIRKSI